MQRASSGFLKIATTCLSHRPLSTSRVTSAAFTTTGAFNAHEEYGHLEKSLPARSLPLLYDYAVPTPSHLLQVALESYLPQVGQNGASEHQSPPVLPSTKNGPQILPTAHHLVYFPPPVGSAKLLPDGTDPLQAPGPPFLRRMWAGGSVRFNTTRPLPLDGSRLACLESLRSVDIKGRPGQEKVFVGIERRIGTCAEGESEDDTRERLWQADEGVFGGSVNVIERRNLVFLRERSKEEAAEDVRKARMRQMAPPGSAEGVDPDFAHRVTPDSKLLFRYSALTYNAHAIHLDREYCRTIEGHRSLLVHGPLSFTLMVSLLGRTLAESNPRQMLESIEYRTLSPLYCDEPLRIAGRKMAGERWEVWVETPEGGVAVKGIARTKIA